MKYADENTFFPELCENYSPVLKADEFGVPRTICSIPSSSLIRDRLNSPCKSKESILI